MRDPSYRIRQYYYQVLADQVQFNGTPVGVYDMEAPAKAAFPFILLGAQTLNSANTKHTFLHDCSIIVIVRTQYPATEQGNRQHSDEILNQVIGIIQPKPITHIDLSPDFYCVSTEISNGRDAQSQDATHKYIERAIRFRHLVGEV